jgi:hypothetical protein
MTVGAIALVFGVYKPRLFHLYIFAAIALGAVVLALAGCVVCLWGIKPRSHRLRDTRFWLAISIDLLLLLSVVPLYLHGINQPDFVQVPTGIANEMPPPH